MPTSAATVSEEVTPMLTYNPQSTTSSRVRTDGEAKDERTEAHAHAQAQAASRVARPTADTLEAGVPEFHRGAVRAMDGIGIEAGSWWLWLAGLEQLSERVQPQ
eukprot:scaffold108979_cov33-Tisochrysis_lutea.AAC.1